MDAVLLLKRVLLNLIFYPSFVLVTVLLPAVSFLPMLLCRLTMGARRTLYLFRVLILWYGFIVVRVLPFPFVRVESREAGRGEKRAACVFVCNHRSSSDAFLMEALNCELVQVVNKWPFKIPVIGMLGRLAGYLNVRSMPFEEFLATACNLLHDGVSVVAFPEGSRSKEGKLGQFHGAVFRVAQTARVPIVPVCISGNQDIPPKGSCILNPGTVKVHRLPALDWESYGDLSPFELKNRVRALIQGELERLEGNPNEGRALASAALSSPDAVELPIDASAYIPHAHEMCVIDDLVTVSEGVGEAVVTVPRSSPFVRADGTMEECLYVEMIAQTMAAAWGFELPVAQRKMLEGYLLGIRTLKIRRSARVGEVLRIRAHKSAEFGEFSVIEGTVKHGSEVLAQGQIKVFLGSGKGVDPGHASK